MRHYATNKLKNMTIVMCHCKCNNYTVLKIPENGQIQHSTRTTPYVFQQTFITEVFQDIMPSILQKTYTKMSSSISKCVLYKIISHFHIHIGFINHQNITCDVQNIHNFMTQISNQKLKQRKKHHLTTTLIPAFVMKQHQLKKLPKIQAS